MNKFFRGAVGAYLIYLGASLISGYLKGGSDSQMAPWMIIFFGCFFVIAGLALIVWLFMDAAKNGREQADGVAGESGTEAASSDAGPGYGIEADAGTAEKAGEDPEGASGRGTGSD